MYHLIQDYKTKQKQTPVLSNHLLSKLRNQIDLNNKYFILNLFLKIFLWVNVLKITICIPALTFKNKILPLSHIPILPLPCLPVLAQFMEFLKSHYICESSPVSMLSLPIHKNHFLSKLSWSSKFPNAVIKSQFSSTEFDRVSHLLLLDTILIRFPEHHTPCFSF